MKTCDYIGLKCLLFLCHDVAFSQIESYQLWAYLGLLQPKTTLAGGAKDELVLIEAPRDVKSKAASITYFLDQNNLII